MTSFHHNHEHSAWRGRSHRRGGNRVRVLRDRARFAADARAMNAARLPDPLDRCNADCGCDELATMVDPTTGLHYDPIYCAEHATPASVPMHSTPAS